ncbi:hypothetical protein DSO57_1008385 [Entomophthora muscae]|uniref:Uncharacterized protein n=1 Tax=Entomophthora muscae TaxID=34485 RepID=A0ACC2RYE6_9FUNG|nr:hypothetical protein DSO57_1008385 [Entomophthora muscae]
MISLYVAGIIDVPKNIMKVAKRTKPRITALLQGYDTEPKRLAQYAAMAYCDDKPIIRKTCGPCKRIDKSVVFKGIYETYLDALV